MLKAGGNRYDKRVSSQRRLCDFMHSISNINVSNNKTFRDTRNISRHFYLEIYDMLLPRLPGLKISCFP